MPFIILTLRRKNGSACLSPQPPQTLAGKKRKRFQAEFVFTDNFSKPIMIKEVFCLKRVEKVESLGN